MLAQLRPCPDSCQRSGTLGQIRSRVCGEADAVGALDWFWPDPEQSRSGATNRAHSRRWVSASQAGPRPARLGAGPARGTRRSGPRRAAPCSARPRRAVRSPWPAWPRACPRPPPRTGAASRSRTTLPASGPPPAAPGTPSPRTPTPPPQTTTACSRAPGSARAPGRGDLQRPAESSRRPRLPRDGAVVGFLWGSWPARALRAPWVPLFLRFARVRGLLGSFPAGGGQGQDRTVDLPLSGQPR